MVNPQYKDFRNVCNRIGLTLLLFLVIFYFSISVFPLISNPVYDKYGDKAGYVTEEIIYGASYLVSFMIPVFIFKKISKHKNTQPIQFNQAFPKYFPLWILAGVGISSALATVNSQLLAEFNIPSSMLIESNQIELTGYVIVLDFIVTALVPAFCEEFLFRGMVLTNLLPYGKATAIIGSAALFSLMHQNPWQTLYTFGAGIILGVVYTYSESIWPGIIIHLINNEISTFYTALIGKSTSQTTMIIYYMIDIALVFAGVVSAIILAKKYYKKANEASIPNECPNDISSREKTKAFFGPTVIIYTVLSVVMWAVILLIPG